MNYYSHHIGDYTTVTAHLSILEDGAYRRLMDRYYTTEAPLPFDEDALFRVMRVRGPEEERAIRTVLSEFFHLTDAGWVNHRCDEDIAAFREKSGKAADAANKRWHKSGNAPAMQTQCDGNADAYADADANGYANGMPPNTHYPIPNNHKPEDQKQSAAAPKYSAKADLLACGVEDQVAADWLAIRKAKKAPASQTALDAIKSEAGKAGLSLNDALRVCCSRGWQGFKAEWVAPASARAGPGQQFQTPNEKAKSLADRLTGKTRYDPSFEFIDITPAHT